MGKSLNGKELGPGFGQRKDGVYFYRYFDSLGKRKTIYAPTYAKVKSKCKDALSAEKQQEREKEQDVESMTVDSWFEIWMDLYKKNLKPSTKQDYDSVYKNHIKPKIGQKLLNDISPLAAQRLFSECENEGATYGVLFEMKCILSNMYYYAIENNISPLNPFAKVVLPNKESSEKIKVLTSEEEKVFLKHCRKARYGNGFCIQLLTGLRSGELRALNWKTDIDFETNTLWVNKTIFYGKIKDDSHYGFIITPPKTNSSSRAVHFDDNCAKILKDQIEIKKAIEEKYPNPNEEFKDLLFVTKTNQPVTNYGYNQSISSAINYVDKSEELPYPFPHISSHVFRHTYATRCFEAKIPPKTVQKQLGHSSLNMTMDLYTHVLDDKISEDISVFSNFMKKLQK